MCAALHQIPEATFGRYVKKLPHNFFELPVDTAVAAVQLQKPGSKFLRDKRIFSDDEELLIAEIVRQSFWSGFGLDKEEFLSFVGQMARKCGLPDFKASVGFYRSFCKRHTDIKPKKTSALDLKRANKANPETRDEMYNRLGDMVTRLFTETLCPWDQAEHWPAHLKYCYDEG